VSPAPSAPDFSWGNVLLLGSGETPNFIDLNASRFHIAHLGLVEACAESPASSRSFETVSIDTSARRETDRIEASSQAIERILAHERRHQIARTAALARWSATNADGSAIPKKVSVAANHM